MGSTRLPCRTTPAPLLHAEKGAPFPPPSRETFFPPREVLTLLTMLVLVDASLSNPGASVP